MAPKEPKQTPFAFDKDEKVLCFHGPYLYEAKILNLEQADPKDKKSAWKYLVHYKGWKNTWDDWVAEDRLRKFNDENKALAADLLKDLRETQRQERAAKSKPSAVAKKDKAAGRVASELGSVRGSEDRSSVGAQPRGVKRARDWETIEKEETFLHRPSIRIPLPDHLKGLLVDDWENVTKSLQLIPLPHPHPVTSLLAAYAAHESPRRRPGSADADILEEVLQGVREYFDKSLGRILLYRFERQQWLEVREKMMKEPGVSAPAPPAKKSSTTTTTTKTKSTRNNNKGDDTTMADDNDDNDDNDDAENSEVDTTTSTSPTASFAGKSPADIYGAEHLCRLFVSMPELIAQTNMDAQSVARLREELVKMTSWLSKESPRWFVKAYVDPGVEYVEASKGGG